MNDAPRQQASSSSTFLERSLGWLSAHQMSAIGGIVAILLALCLCSFVGLRGLFGGDSTTPTPTIGVFVPPTTPPNAQIGNVRLGAVTLTDALTEDNRPTRSLTTFAPGAPIIYAVLEGKEIPQGTKIFARWVRDGETLLDTAEITAEQSYGPTFVQFHIQPNAAGGLKPGNYQVLFFINGTPGPAASFSVR